LIQLVSRIHVAGGGLGQGFKHKKYNPIVDPNMEDNHDSNKIQFKKMFSSAISKKYRFYPDFDQYDFIRRGKEVMSSVLYRHI
jgi:hypothetical protein